jgi:beta-1,2-mannobiose phosphorylase / 1,2-beta-oligomannan phosphorylase
MRLAMNNIFTIIAISVVLLFTIRVNAQSATLRDQSASLITPDMYFSDSTDTGVFLAKDPVVVNFKGSYFMYYSRKMRYEKADGMLGWGIGIAQSSDLTHWKKIAEINPAAAYEQKGLCAPGALIRDGKVHLFYQTYGNGPKDAICHAISTDGINFVRDESNPIFRPTGDWNNGRAIDAEVYGYKNRYFLYFATRDAAGKIQKQGVAVAPGNTNFNKAEWKQAVDSSILQPMLRWEGECVEGASVIKKNNKLYMFYAGSYNNAPQQIGVAVSKDGVSWKRLSDQVFLANGKPGSWNSSESGHPCIFEDRDGKTYLFYQGNNDKGRTWYLSKVQIGWTTEGPYIIH